MNNGKIYLAGAFFNDEQLNVMNKIEDLCKEYNLDFFSPRLECNCPKDATMEQRTKAFNMNIEHIKDASFILARIDDFDAGTMWEMGYAFANKKSVVAFTTVEHRGLNLMLAQSCSSFLKGWSEIEEYLDNIDRVNFTKKSIMLDLNPPQEWLGEII